MYKETEVFENLIPDMKENLQVQERTIMSEKNFRSDLFDRTVEMFNLFLPILRSAELRVSGLDIIPGSLIEFVLENRYEVKVEFSDSPPIGLEAFSIKLTNPRYHYSGEIISCTDTAGMYDSSSSGPIYIRYFYYKLICQLFSETLAAFHRPPHLHGYPPLPGTGTPIWSSISDKVKNYWGLDSVVPKPELLYSRLVFGVILTPDSLYPMCVIDLWISTSDNELQDTSGLHYDDIDDYLINKILIKS